MVCQVQLPGHHEKGPEDFLQVKLSTERCQTKNVNISTDPHPYLRGANFYVFRYHTSPASWTDSNTIETNSGFGSVAQARSADNRNPGFVAASLAIQLH